MRASGSEQTAAHVRRTRVLLVGMHGMMRDIVDAAVEAAPDMEVVGCVHHTELDTAVERLEPDVAITGAPNGEGAGLARRMVLGHPRLKVVVISRDGGSARLIELRQIVVDDLSPAALIETIRAALQTKAN